MFVHDPTGFGCVLCRGRLTDELAALSVGLERSYRVAGDGELQPVEPAARGPADPPDIRRLLLWRDTSVTAAGSVRGPSAPPYARSVTLRVDRTEHRLAVFGPRRWQRDRRGELGASAPEPFGEVALGWELAFGGRYEAPPSVAPGTDLPHPGGPVAYPWNPKGIGLYPDEAAAEGAPLPAIELATELVRSFTDRPQPGGLTPCADLPALRSAPLAVAPVDPAGGVLAAASVRGAEPFGPDLLRHALRLQHHAPGPLIFPWLAPGTALGLDGVGPRSLACRVPSPPIAVTVRRGRGGESLAGRVRSVHLDSEQRRLRVTFAFFHRYEPARAPHWIDVSARGGAP